MPPSLSGKTGLPLRWQGTPDGRSLGKPIQLVRDYLAAHPEGTTREELEQIIRARHGQRALASPRSLARLLNALKAEDEVAEVEGRIVPRRLTRTTGGRNA